MTRYKTPPVIPLLLLIQAILMVSCYEKRSERLPRNEVQKEAYVPIYGSTELARTIRAETARQTVEAGKIYVLGNYLFQVEKMQGIHVIDYSNRKSPKKIGFITSVGASEVAVKNGYLITNNRDDLVTIDIRQLDSVKEVARITNAFPHFYEEVAFPPLRGIYFVCPDYTKGDVIGWKLEKNVRNATCL